MLGFLKKCHRLLWHSPCGVILGLRVGLYLVVCYKITLMIHGMGMTVSDIFLKKSVFYNSFYKCQKKSAV